MEVKLSVNQIVGAFGLLNGAQLYKVENKMSVIKLIRALKPHVEEFDSFRDDVIDKMKPEDYDARIEAYNGGDKHALDNYQAEVSNAINEQLNRQISVSFEPLSEDTMLQMVSERMTIGQIMELIDIFCG